ncbi:21S rRNA (uridine(2791)-2'-O)-methyltransferase [Purpureocillium takamizusanense]|uniref:21S rRNA (Uridine(2791)-2'-O)-methyltransferase n=1 Tax=Purpureocillium takamizusanense TaxID=2060973 RepID=A0A9Q8V8A7_9HYPO|nr:21S rRNA (uridine(2791)-2'-O)-methyltransferase [Purpureocillium takamizusanense]UNI15617.1 21S rRNA (uridine(2791)-2'-O)-methyltransferase [Purpureocillium takamizusanense]
MGANSSERTTRIHQLELRRRDNIHKTESIGRDEEARLLKLRTLAMRDETAALKEKITQKDAKIMALKKQSDAVRVELDDAKRAARSQETRLKKQDIELANLQAEVNSLNGSVQDSGKALQEKFALKRELDRLRPEMEHLQSQLANYQAMVAEKNDLRRQLDSVEVELENEKRSRQRVQFKEDEPTISDLKARLVNAEKKLAAEVKEREKAKKEHDRELSEAQAHSERLEERIESLKTRYKTTHTELKETRAQLEQCQEELEQSKKKTTRAPGAKDVAKKSVAIESGLGRKRRAQEMSFEDITIQTPGNEEVANKRLAAKKRGEKAALGEKSTFSITPFLNRTGKSVSDESLEASAHDESELGPDTTFADKGDSSKQSLPVIEPEDPEAAAEAPQEPAPKPKVQLKPATKTAASKAAPKEAPKARGRPRTKGLSEAPPAQANKAIAKVDVSPAESGADASMEKEKGNEAPPMVTVALEQENATAKASRKAPALQPKAPEGDVKKKRRKLLGAANSTLFDDDDDAEAAVAKPVKPAAPAGKRVRAQLGGGVRNAFAGSSFSPLKRDRRGVNASFLA